MSYKPYWGSCRGHKTHLFIGIQSPRSLCDTAHGGDGDMGYPNSRICKLCEKIAAERGIAPAVIPTKEEKAAIRKRDNALWKKFFPSG